MIRINLLSTKKAKPLVVLWRDASIMGGTILVLLFGILYLNHGMNKKLTTVRSQINNTQKQIESSKMDLKKIEELKNDKAILENKIQIINSLRKKQSWPVHMLDQLGLSIPDNIWLVSLFNKADMLKLEGLTPSYNAVSDFMKGLSDSPWFKSIELENIQQNIIKDMIFHKFRISCIIEFLPSVEEKEAGSQQKG